MSDAAQARPPHGALACVVLALLSLALAPLSLAFALVGASAARLGGGGSKPPKGAKRPTALVNGGRMQKSLYVVRALAAQGYRVVLVEERGWNLCATRFSNAVQQFRTVPGGGGRAYVDALVKIALSEQVSLFVPCSGAGTTVDDAQAADLMHEKSGGRIRTLIQDAELAATLHEKDRFIDLVHELDLAAPQSRIVRSPEAALEYLRAQDLSKGGVLLKAATVLDDVGRADMTTYPLLAPSGQPDWPATEKRLRGGMAITIAKDTPYVAQEFIGGVGASEWCTHATVWEGEVVAFVCCPSNDMLMTYHNATQTEIGRLALAWTRTFLERLAKHPQWTHARLNGQFSLDFIHQPASERLVVIECNPRVHTAVCLLQASPAAFGAALAGRAEKIVSPGPRVTPVSWLGHDLIARILPRVLPASCGRSLYGAAFVSSSAEAGAKDLDVPSYNLEQVGRDGAWLASDPVAFLAFYHLQWPWLLLRQALLRRRAFSRLNLSTARIFEC